MEQARPIRNPALKKAIEMAKKEPGTENTVRLLNEVVRARLLIPVSMDRAPQYDKESGEVVLEKDTQISFELIKANNGDLYYPVFTDGEEMKKCDIEKDQHSMIVDFEDMAAILLQPQNAVRGFAVNPMSGNICFTADMIADMKKDMDREKRKEKDNGKKSGKDI